MSPERIDQVLGLLTIVALGLLILAFLVVSVAALVLGVAQLLRWMGWG